MSWNGSLETAATTQPTKPKSALDPKQLNADITAPCRTSSTTAGRSFNNPIGTPPTAAAPLVAGLPTSPPLTDLPDLGL